jgi:hypothetical protein
MGKGIIFLGINAAKSRSFPNTVVVAEVKNGWSYMPNPPFAFMACSETNCAQCIAL